jgi:hypothetical protein
MTGRPVPRCRACGSRDRDKLIQHAVTLVDWIWACSSCARTYVHKPKRRDAQNYAVPSSSTPSSLAVSDRGAQSYARERRRATNVAAAQKNASVANGRGDGDATNVAAIPGAFLHPLYRTKRAGPLLGFIRSSATDSLGWMKLLSTST